MDESAMVAEAVEAARRAPDDVGRQIAAAYACDRYGDEAEAILYYDAAWRLGVGAGERRNFMIGYGSTLRNVGRLDESIAILGQATSEYVGFAPARAFLALSLHSAGRHDDAMAAALTAVLEAAGGTDALDRYGRALGHYRDELEARRMRP